MTIPEDVLFEANDSSNLLVSFGGIKQGVGMPVFEFYKSLEGINCDKCFVKDNNQSWYHNGLGEDITSIDELLIFLENLISKRQYKRVCFLGNSMGGYAAMLFGVLLNVDHVIAFSPQTFIDKWSRFIYKDKRWAEQINKARSGKTTYSEYFNLKKGLKKHNNYNGLINLYYSSSDKLDSIHAERLKSIKFINLYPHVSGGHNLVKALRDSGELNQILNQLFK